jgi:two-component system KDP operon response regulator KdpE
VSSPEQARILIVDDDRRLVAILSDLLGSHGYHVFSAEDGAGGLRAFREHAPDLVLLDVLMPRMDGFETCMTLRQFSTVPIIVVSCVQDEASRVRALDLGADDFMTKPFGTAELLARIRAVLRFPRRCGPEESVVRVDYRLRVDRARCVAWVDGREVNLSSIELRLLNCFLENRNRILTHQALLTQVWGWEYADQTEYVKVFVHHLRQKIEPDPKHPCYIITERGLGYRFETGSAGAHDGPALPKS